MTTKANGNDVDVFGVGLLGYLSQTPVVNAEPGTVPFAIDFDPAGNLVIAEAGTNSLATYSSQPRRNGHAPQSCGDRPGCDVLGRVDRAALLRLECR